MGHPPRPGKAEGPKEGQLSTKTENLIQNSRPRLHYGRFSPLTVLGRVLGTTTLDLTVTKLWTLPKRSTATRVVLWRSRIVAMSTQYKQIESDEVRLPLGERVDLR